MTMVVWQPLSTGEHPFLTWARRRSYTVPGCNLDRRTTPQASKDQRNDEQDQEDDEQDPGNLRRDCRNAPQAQSPGYQSDHEKNYRQS
jgi:hypothetical protein